MKPFEEQYTAWIDGGLRGEELAAFERELKDRAGAEAERADAQKLGHLLRVFGTAPQLTNAEFFNQRIAEQIAVREPARTGWRWSMPRLAWAGIALLVLSAALFKVMLPRGGHGDTDAPYFAQVLSADAGDPDLSVTPIHMDDEQVTFIWIDGLEDMPPGSRLQ